MATILTILENPIAGGATVWPYAGISVFGKKGAALFWHNTFSSDIPDTYTRHVARKYDLLYTVGCQLFTTSLPHIILNMSIITPSYIDRTIYI